MSKMLNEFSFRTFLPDGDVDDMHRQTVSNLIANAIRSDVGVHKLRRKTGPNWSGYRLGSLCSLLAVLDEVSFSVELETVAKVTENLEP